MCIRAPLMLDEFHLNYIADFKMFRNKNVSQAAKSIVNLYRDLNPRLLKKEHRGYEINILDED
jgi:protein SDA1